MPSIARTSAILKTYIWCNPVWELDLLPLIDLNDGSVAQTLFDALQVPALEIAGYPRLGLVIDPSCSKIRDTTARSQGYRPNFPSHTISGFKHDHCKAGFL